MSHEKPELQQTVEDLQQTCAGEYPEGPLNAHDEGALAIGVGVENGAVVVRFPKPVSWFAVTPEQAMQIAAALVGHARKAGFREPMTLRL